MTSHDTRLIAMIKTQMASLAGGKRYDIAFETFDQKSLHELSRFIIDAGIEAQHKARQAQRTPWRRP